MLRTGQINAASQLKTNFPLIWGAMCKGTMNRFLVILMAFSLAGCKANYIDISNDPAVSRYIGLQYSAKQDMEIAGISLPPGYGDTVDIYRLGELYAVQHKAPEEITTEVFPKGGTFTILKVYECKNCLIFGKVRYLTLKTSDFTKAANVPIKIAMHEIESEENVAPIK